MVMLAKPYKNQDPTGWLMSEKLDGVRALWKDGHLESRAGNGFHAPHAFLKGLPKGLILDGELWEGRGKFQSTVSKVRRHVDPWLGVRYMIFDIIMPAPFGERLKTLHNLIGLPRHCEIVPQYFCNNVKHLRDFEEVLILRGGEGVILKNPHSFYSDSRSNDMLKVKRFNTSEAKIVGYTEGEGKHYGRMGAVVCSGGGKTFKVGSGFTNAERELPPAIGSIITYSHFGLTDAGKPRQPTFIAVRNYE